MPRDLTRLDWLALLVVDEAAEVGAKEPVAPSYALRLALGHLHSIADGPIFALPNRRHIFDALWKVVTGPIDGGNPHSAAYARSAMTDSCLQQIGRQIGQHQHLFREVRDFRRRDRAPTQHEELAAAVRQAAADREQGIDDKRRYYWRPPPRGER